MFIFLANCCSIKQRNNGIITGDRLEIQKQKSRRACFFECTSIKIYIYILDNDESFFVLTQSD